MRSRAWRRHQKKRVARARRKFATPERGLSDNELQQRHPYDCGGTCLMCHGDKFYDKSRRRQAWAREAARELSL